MPIALLRMVLRASYADLAQMERAVSGSDLAETSTYARSAVNISGT